MFCIFLQVISSIDKNTIIITKGAGSAVRQLRQRHEVSSRHKFLEDMSPKKRIIYSRPDDSDLVSLINLHSSDYFYVNDHDEENIGKMYYSRKRTVVLEYAEGTLQMISVYI